MMGKLKDIKDKGLSTAVKAMLNEKYKQYGKVTSVSIDTSAHSVSATLDLIGEKEPVQLTLTRYEVVRNGADTVVRLGRIESSRDWLGMLLDHIADQTLEGRCYPIENRAAAELVRKLL